MLGIHLHFSFSFAAFTTTVKIIQEGKPVPDGIWAAYPALDMNFAV